MIDIFNTLSEKKTWITFSIASTYILYRCGTSTFHTFSEQGIPGPKPIPFIGNMWGMWKQNLPHYDRLMAKTFGKIYGTFDGMKPNLHVNDIELIKSIFVRDFDHFINRRRFQLPEEKVVRYILSLLENQAWKDVRSAITPSFATDKMKQYSIQMKECADNLCSSLQLIAASQGKINLKEQMNLVIVSVIEKCAFGMTVESLNDKNNYFMERAQQIFAAPINKSPMVLLAFILPDGLLQRLEGLVFKNEAFKFFTKMLQNLVEKRSQSTQDFLKVASESIAAYTKEENGKVIPMWTKEQVDELVAAQATLFLLAGFNTTTNVLSSCCFMLARNPQVQEKLYDLINSKIYQYEDVCHEMLQELPYLDHFLNEVLRMFPPIVRLERVCNKDVTYNDIHIRKGMIVSVSTYALHYSEDYYSDPETFDPNRWDTEAKANFVPSAFMPFGLGPRNCIGMQFAREEIKLILCTLIKQYQFFPVEETPEKIVFEDGFNGITQSVELTIGIASRV